MFYQSGNSLYSDLWKIENGVDFSFPLHLHSSFEFITVTEGSMTITVDKKQYALHPGKGVLIFPNEAHALISEEHSAHTLCIFSPKLVQAYSGVFLSKRPLCHLFEPNRFYLDQLFALNAKESSLRIKGLLYSLCADFDASAVYRNHESEKEELLFKIFQFVESHYTTSCSLEALSAETSYHGVYLSHYFKQMTGLTYTDYVNRYRVNEAGYLLKNGGESILQVAYDCGFDSLRSFNRNFKKVMGVTPSEYRKTTLDK